MSNNNAMKVKRSDAAIWRVIDGEVVILDSDDVSINVLTGCGSRIWEFMEKETTIPEITRMICAEYEVEPQQAEEDIIEFIKKLSKKKLVDISPVFEGAIR